MQEIKPDLKISLMGNPRIIQANHEINEGLSKKGIALLAYLVSGPAEKYQRQELAGLLWGDTDEKRSHYNFRRELWSLRKVINPPNASHNHYIGFEKDYYTFNKSSSFWLDINVFEQAISSVLKFFAPESEENKPISPQEEIQLSNAVDLYRGDFMASFYLPDCPAYEDWIFLERERLRLNYFKALRLLGSNKIRQGAYPQAIKYYQKIISLDPTNEPAYQELMLIYAALGNQKAAMAQYQLLRQTLKFQLDLMPSPETKALYDSIRSEGLPSIGITYRLNQSRGWPSSTGTFPFVGREKEQASLAEAIRASNQGESKVVAISGEIGAGKTRLVEQCLQRWESEGIAIFRARCYLQEDSLPYQPFIDALRAYLPNLNLAHLARLDNLWVFEVSKLLPELRHLLPHLLPGPQLFPEQEQNRLFEGMAQFFAHLSQNSTIVLFLDDLDYADGPSIKMLHYLSRRLAQTHVLLLFTIRLTSLAERPDVQDLVWSLKRSDLMINIKLDHLTKQIVDKFLQDVLPGTRQMPQLKEVLYQSSGGNPFFLVELVRALRENQLPSYEKLPIPDSVNEVIQHRLGRLDEMSLQALRTASVFGTRFDSAVLRKMFPGQEEKLVEVITRLIEWHWIEPLPGSRSGIYDFSHGLVREVVYQQIPAELCQLLHQRIANALQSSGFPEGEIAGILALHFAESGDTAQAREYALKAAEHSQRLYAFREAMAYYQQALGIESQQDTTIADWHRLHVLLEIGKLHQILGEYEQAETTYQEILTQKGYEQPVEELLLDPFYRQVHFQRALNFDQRGEYQEALKTLHVLQGTLATLDDPASIQERANIARGIARVLLNQEQSHQALALCNQALALLKRLEQSEERGTIEVATYYIMACSYFMLGNYRDAVTYYEQALNTARHQEQEAIIPRLLIGLGDVARRRGEYEHAEGYAQESLTLCKKIGLVDEIAAAQGTLGFVAYNRGRLDEAMGYFDQALKICRQLGDRHGIADYCLSLAFVLLDREEVEAAQALLDEAYEIGQAINSEMVLTRALYHSANTAKIKADIENAIIKVGAALQTAEQAGIKMMEALSCRLLGEILDQEHESAQAERYIQRSLSILEKLEERFEAAWTLRSYARLFLKRNERQRAINLFSEAITIFEDLGAQREYERTRAEFLLLKEE
jgi:predicted ATPase/DNA-binding SARP family transcriptional activator